MVGLHDNICIIFAKWPEEGKVKTRLAAGSSNSFAKQFYVLCCERLIEQLSNHVGWQCTVAYSPLRREREFEHWLARYGQLAFAPQKADPDLGRRMAFSMQQALMGGSRKVVLVGSDIPDLTPSIVDKAFRLLDNAQVVLGPAVDGGFYLIGAIITPEGFLKDIAWSTSSVLEVTTRQCRELGLTVDDKGLPRLTDIDTIQDLHTWMEFSPAHPLHEPIKQLLGEDSPARH